MNIPTRVSLLVRMKDLGDEVSWQDFFERYWKLLHRVAIKAGLTEAEAQDVVEETVIAVARRMPEFEYVPGRDSFKGWLLQIVRWKIADQYRRRPPVVENFEADRNIRKTRVIEAVPDPDGDELDAIWETEWQKHLLKAAMKNLKSQVSPEHYEMFTLYVVKERPAEEVARQCGVNVEQVYLIKHRLSAQLKKEIKNLETKLI